jgi:integrase
VRNEQRAASDVTIGELIRRYMKVRESSRPLGDSHSNTLNKILTMSIAERLAARLDSSDILDMAHELRARVCPATVRQYLTFLRGPLKYASIGFGLKGVSDAAIIEAGPLLDQLQLAGKSRPRNRRPEPGEWEALLDYFTHQDKHPNARIQMATVIKFAKGSLRRRGEIVRLRWEDFEDGARPMMTIRDMKDPKFKIGNHHRFPLLFGTAEIIRAQSMVNERIFPWDGRSVGKRFIDAKKALKIKDLRFHDIRRHGICIMLELGYSPAQVAAVSGHKNWNTLARVYGASTNPEDIHAGPAGAQRTPEEAEKLQAAALPVDEEADE